MMETPSTEMTLCCLRLDRKSVTGARCHVTPNPLTHCHATCLTPVVSLFPPNTSCSLNTQILLLDPPTSLGVLTMKNRGSERTSGFAKAVRERGGDGATIDVHALEHCSARSRRPGTLFVFFQLFIMGHRKHLRSKHSLASVAYGSVGRHRTLSS